MPPGAVISVADNSPITKGVIFVTWDPYTIPIITEVKGNVNFEDLKEGVTVREEENPVTGIVERVVVEHKQEFHPQIIVTDDKKEVIGIYRSEEHTSQLQSQFHLLF